MRTRQLSGAGAALLLVVLASTESALAAVDCNPAPAHHGARRRSHHGPTKPHPTPAPRPKPAVKRAADHECQPRPVAVTLADITALGSPDDSDTLTPVAGFAPGPGPDSPETERGGLQTIAFALPLSGSGGPGGGPGGGGASGGGGGPGVSPGGGPGGGGPGGGGPGGYPPPPGPGGPPPGGPGFPGGSPIGVPEPSTWTMMLVGLGGAGLVARGRRRAPAA